MADFSKIDTSIKVLVVDDHALTRTMVQSILKSVSFRNIRQADSGRAALEKLEQDQFDLVICDWNMPNLTGIEALLMTRKGGANQNVIWLMLTAEAYPENVMEAVEAGTSGYVAKPFTADVLLNKIHELCIGKYGTS